MQGCLWTVCVGQSVGAGGSLPCPGVCLRRYCVSLFLLVGSRYVTFQTGICMCLTVHASVSVGRGR